MPSQPPLPEDDPIRSVACLRFFGDDLSPDEITALLGHSPSDSFRRGDVEIFDPSGRTRVQKTGGWLLENPGGEGDFDAHIAALLTPLTQDLSIWQSLATRYQPDIFCGYFMNRGTCGIELAVATMDALASRGIRFIVCLYAASKED
ncbi:MAG: hypothetical protein JWO82_2046 [Akkermansiaceae bacterium]|nr:hypothetical protein [Akkermansiaceae bacterium]